MHFFYTVLFILTNYHTNFSLVRLTLNKNHLNCKRIYYVLILIKEPRYDTAQIPIQATKINYL